MKNFAFLMLMILPLLASSFPQYEEYGVYEYDDDYQEYFDYEEASERSDQDLATRFSRQTFPNQNTRNTNTRGNTRQQPTTTTEASRPSFQRQQQSARQTANPPLGPYRYGYAVTDEFGLDFNQQETSDGGVVTGSYSVVLPDGRIQTVTYSVAPDTGYVAEVSYSGGDGGVVFEGQAGK